MLLESSIDYLGVDDPFITVPQQHIDEFRPLLSKFNFVEKGKFPNYYRKGSCEFCFNGLLEWQYQGEEKSPICDFTLARHCSEVGCCDGLLSVR